MKRFYKTVSIEQGDFGYKVTLDGRDIKTPAKNTLILPSEYLAEHVAEEWRAQGEHIAPDTMPVTQYCYTALDYIPAHKDEIIPTVLNYLDTDLICYCADAPDELVQIQDGSWGPYRSWFKDTYGVILKTTTGLSAIKQDEAAHKAVADYVYAIDDWRLAVFQTLTAASGSIILALHFLHNPESVDMFFDACFVEERYQGTIYDEEKYGLDPSEEKKRNILKQDLKAASIFLNLS